MKCSLCGMEFSREDARSCCSGCGLMKNCGLVKCPNCGFESAGPPGWFDRAKERRKRTDDTDSKS